MTKTDQTRHPGDEKLLAYLDGELGRADRNQVRSHLESCWDCRLQQHQLEEAIASFVGARRQWAEREVDNDRVSLGRFEHRLDEIDRDRVRRPLPARFVDGLRRLAPAATRSLVPRLAALALVVAGGWYWLATRPVQTVSAAELLLRIENRQTSLLGAVDSPVVYREVEFHRGPRAGSESETARLEFWTETTSGRRQGRGRDDLLRELDEIFEENQMGDQPLLSAESYRSWRESSTLAEETVSASGDNLFKLQGRISEGGPNRIVEHDLLVRADDWHPVGQRFLVGGERGEVEYAVRELRFDIVSPNDVPSDLYVNLFSPRESLPDLIELAPKREQEAAVLAMSLADPALVQVLYELHRSGACRNDLVRATEGPDGVITIRGIVDGAARRRELEATVAALGLGERIRNEIRSVEEASSAEELIEALRGFDLSRPGLRSPLETDGATGEVAGTLAASRSAVVEATALRHLAERFGGDEAGRLSAEAGSLLVTMVEEHLESLNRHLTQMETRLSGEPAANDLPVDSASRPGESWAEEALRVADEADRLYGLVAGGSEDETAAGEILARVRVLRAGPPRIRRLLDARGVGGEFRRVLNSKAGPDAASDAPTNGPSQAGPGQ